ncbi:hypothetical protein ACOBQX_29455 [Actinokineospora sp. G85]|uniref:hypothetical protein n=1 Tax=Actinokineospora sp. G85 TaxID=3406626 RepID=UPI003C70AD0F
MTPGLGWNQVPSGRVCNEPRSSDRAACFDAAQWTREPAVDDPSLHTNVDAPDNYVARRGERLLRIDPDAVTRSIQRLRAETAIDPDLAVTATELESDAEACAEALSTPWREMSDQARRTVSTRGSDGRALAGR